MILLIYNWSPPLLYFGTSYIVQLRKHFHESTAQQTWKWETWKLSHTRFSLKLSIWYIITKTVWFYNYMYIQFLQVNWFPSLNFRHPLKSKVCLKFIQRFLWIDFHHCCYQLIKITWLITIFIDFYFYILATLGFNYTRNYMHHCYFERAAGLNREKLGAHKAEDDFKPHGFEEKIRFFRFF